MRGWRGRIRKKKKRKIETRKNERSSYSPVSWIAWTRRDRVNGWNVPVKNVSLFFGRALFSFASVHRPAERRAAGFMEKLSHATTRKLKKVLTSYRCAATLTYNLRRFTGSELGRVARSASPQKVFGANFDYSKCNESASKWPHSVSWSETANSPRVVTSGTEFTSNVSTKRLWDFFPRRTSDA